MTEYLNECGYQINRKRVSRWMGELGLWAIYPGPKLSAPGKDSKKYPYHGRTGVEEIA
jgi:putative transposase